MELMAEMPLTLMAQAAAAAAGTAMAAALTR